VIFADEPTGSLDSLTGEKVMDLLMDLARQQGATVVIVTHEARIAAYADRVATVRDGIVSSVDLPTVPASPATAAKGVN
jgi:putative ABC transport system ATP-binding protein